MTIDLKHLRTLQALRDAGNLTTTAARLHLTQSALSHQLASLEERLGLRLFVRKSRPLRFTEAGRRLLAAADEVLPRLQGLERELARLAAGKSGRLHIALECHSCFDWLMPALDAYHSAWPGIEVDLSLAFAFDALPALRRGDVDLVITSDPQRQEDVAYAPLFQYQMLLVMARDHPLQARDYIRPEDLAAETLITYPVEAQRLDVFRRFLGPAGVAPARVRSSELTAMMLQLAASGRGVCALPSWAFADFLDREYVAARPLGAEGLWSTLYAAVRREEAALPHCIAFLDTASTTSRKVLRGIRPAAVQQDCRQGAPSSPPRCRSHRGPRRYHGS
jgi:LysR family transcriptional regulator for metE and metH